MILTKYTCTNFPQDEVLWLVNHAVADLGLDPTVTLEIDNWKRGPWGTAHRKYLHHDCMIKLHLCKITYPHKHKYYNRKTAPPYILNSWQEQVVALAAHEGRHIWQFMNVPRASEIDAEYYTIERLKHYRNVLHFQNLSLVA